MQIRQSTSDDVAGILALYPQAFPEEDLVPVVTALLEDPPIRMSLIATIDEEIVGNVIYTTCSVEGEDARIALLAPLAVSPGFQRQGIGSKLVHDGLHRLGEADFDLVCVLGDPAYYGRLGFVPERRVGTPFPLPPEWADAWQSRPLGDLAIAGNLLVPAQWQRPELWSG